MLYLSSQDLGEDDSEGRFHGFPRIPLVVKLKVDVTRQKSRRLQMVVGCGIERIDAELSSSLRTALLIAQQTGRSCCRVKSRLERSGS